ncbi:MAG: MFS transporter [Anaerolineae bacterium]|nr:MFS transporter [Anaerolineae bacterium]
MALVIVSVLLGLAINISLPIILLIGQEVLPGGASGASGYAFGLTFFAGGIANLAIGPLADAIGLQEALTAVGALPLVAALAFLGLPAPPGQE